MQPQHAVTLRIRRLMPLVAFALVATFVLAHASPAHAEAIFLDPGHGGRYPGAVYSGVEEQWVNLLIALEARDILLARGHRVMLSRTTDVTLENGDRPTWHYVEAEDQFYLYADGKTGVYSYLPDSSPIPYDDLQIRCDQANTWGADVFVSIHNNAGGTSAQGTETFYNSWTTPADLEAGSVLASYIQEEVVTTAGTYDRRVDDIGFYVIKWANMPSALVEVAFLSNAADRARLLSPTFRYNAAQGIADGIERYLAEDPIQPREERIEGADRYGTAAAAALAAWPEGADTVIVASGQTWPDSLAAAPLSHALDAPVVLATESGLTSETAAAIATLDPSSIVLLGGERALTSAVTTAVAEAASIETTMVSRIAGADRYETAALIAAEVGADGGEVILVNGKTYPDAVSASAYAAMAGTPILLTRASGISTAAAGFLASNEETLTGAIVIGGPAVIAESLVGELEESMPVEWLFGADRYATNLAVLQRFWAAGDVRPYVATGTDFPDALVAGAIAGRDGQPVLLCGARYLPATTREWIMHDTARIPSFTMVGGPNALSYLLEWEFVKARRVPEL